MLPCSVLPTFTVYATPACIPADAKMKFPGGPAVGCQRPAYLNRLLCTLLPFFTDQSVPLSRRWVGMELFLFLLLLLLSYYYYRLHGILCFYASVSGVQPSISPTASLQSTPYITLSLLGHWLLPIFTPQLMYDAP